MDDIFKEDFRNEEKAPSFGVCEPDSFGSPAHSAETTETKFPKLFEEPVKAPSVEPSTPHQPQHQAGGSYGSNVAEPVTPGSDDSAVNYNQFMFDTIMWTNKFRSVLYLMGGLLLIGLAYRLLFSRTTLVAGLCYVALYQMALNFCRQLISPAFQERCTWYDSVWTYAAINYFGNALKALAALNDRHMDGSNPIKTLRVGAGLWMISVLGRYVSAVQLAFGLWTLAFTLPKAYMMFQHRVNRVSGAVFSVTKTKFNAVDKRVRSVVVVLPILVAGYVLSRVDLAVAVFLLLVYLRSWMQPCHVEMVKKNLVPITNTASRLGSRFGSFAMDQAVAYNVYPTPTPAKSKLF